MRWVLAAALVVLVSERPTPSFESRAEAAIAIVVPPSAPPPEESVGERLRDLVRREITVPVVPKKVHLKKDQVTSAIARLAARYLDRPMLSETIRTVDGKRYSFCVEPHYHAPGSGLTPEGWHKGVTVYGFEE